MNKKEAYTLLGLTNEANFFEIKEAYEEAYSSLQIRVTNSPTESLKKMFQEELQQLEEAYALFEGEDHLNNLPASKPADLVKEKGIDREPVIIEKEEGEKEENGVRSVEEATELLGTGTEFTREELEAAYHEKRRNLEKGRSEASLDVVRKGYESGIKELEAAYKLLEDKVIIKQPDPVEQSENKPSADKLLSLMELAHPLYIEDLEAKYREKKKLLSQNLEAAKIKSVQEGYENGIQEVEVAYAELRKIAISKPKVENVAAPVEKAIEKPAVPIGSKNTSSDSIESERQKETKKENKREAKSLQEVNTDAVKNVSGRQFNFLLGAGVFIASVGLLVWHPWSSESYIMATSGMGYFWVLGILACIYLSMHLFSEGLVPVKLSEKYSKQTAVIFFICVCLVLLIANLFIHIWASLQEDSAGVIWGCYTEFTQLGMFSFSFLYSIFLGVVFIVGIINPVKIRFKNRNNVMWAILFNWVFCVLFGYLMNSILLFAHLHGAEKSCL